MKIETLSIIEMMSVNAMNTCNKLCVIGAGASGLVIAKTFQDMNFEIKVFEANHNLGGVWRYENCNGMKRNPMYRNLVSNLPKEIMAFDEENPFQSSLPSFITHTDVLNYLIAYSCKYDLEKLIYFSTVVMNCRQEVIENQQQWLVEYHQIDSQIVVKEYFDFVIVCNGHYDVPFIPQLEGLDSFVGNSIHSKEYDHPEAFEGQKVLVVGGRSSGTDIARELTGIAQKVYVSDRNLTPSMIELLNSNKKPITHLLGLKRVISNSNRIETVDDQQIEVDTILWCTGYLYFYPFLKSLCQSEDSYSTILESTWFHSEIAERGSRVVPELYKQLVFIPNPTLAFIGLPYSVVPFPLFKIQGLYLRKVYDEYRRNGCFKLLPLTTDMYTWLLNFESSLKLKYTTLDKSYHSLSGDLQFDYSRDLLQEIDIHDERLIHHISMIQDIYKDVTAHRPEYVGAIDSYRRRNYFVDWKTFKWTVSE